MRVQTGWKGRTKKIKVWGLWAVSSYRRSRARICKGELGLTWVTKGQWLVSISVSGMLAAGCWFESSQSEGQLQFWTLEPWCSQIFSEVTCFGITPKSSFKKFCTRSQEICLSHKPLGEVSYAHSGLRPMRLCSSSSLRSSSQILLFPICLLQILFTTIGQTGPSSPGHGYL